MDDAQSKQFSVRIEALHDQLSQNLSTGELPSAKATAEALDQFHSLVHEVNALPLKR